MAEKIKSLKQLKKEAKTLDLNVREWAELAGLPWQSVYRKIAKPSTLRLDEYVKLDAALEPLRKERADAGRA